MTNMCTLSIVYIPEWFSYLIFLLSHIVLPSRRDYEIVPFFHVEEFCSILADVILMVKMSQICFKKLKVW